LVPLASEAQRPRTIPRIAYLALAPGPWAISSEAFVQGLGELGYVEGQHLILEYRWSAGNVDWLRENAAELVRLGVDVIVTGGPLATRAAKDMTSTIPIVMARDFDPVADGFVASLGRPGGNITGVSALTRELSKKRLELLKDTVPVTLFHRARLVDLAAKSRLPAMYWERVFAEAGGLISYAASDRAMHRRAAYYPTCLWSSPRSSSWSST
jgi:putative ABC transport system substrate-binding protein